MNGSADSLFFHTFAFLVINIHFFFFSFIVFCFPSNTQKEFIFRTTYETRKYVLQESHELLNKIVKLPKVNHRLIQNIPLIKKWPFLNKKESPQNDIDSAFSWFRRNFLFKFSAFIRKLQIVEFSLFSSLEQFKACGIKYGNNVESFETESGVYVAMDFGLELFNYYEWKVIG